MQHEFSHLGVTETWLRDDGCVLLVYSVAIRCSNQTETFPSFAYWKFRRSEIGNQGFPIALKIGRRPRKTQLPMGLPKCNAIHLNTRSRAFEILEYLVISRLI